jgi:hypothetical protein
MGWMNLFAKAKENHARSRRAVWHGRTFMIGAIFAAAGGYGLYSDVKHQVHGKPATATLMEHIQRCTVEYQRIGEEKRKEQWPCELAEEFQRRVGSNKVKLSRDYVAHVRFQLADGRTHEANVDDIKLGSLKLAIGAPLPVVYTPNNPADVRAKMSWETLKIPLIMLAIGLPFLALSFGVSLSTLLGGAFRGRTSRAGDEWEPSEHLVPALTRVSEPSESSKIQRRPDTVSTPRRPDTVSTPRPVFGMRNR